MTQIKKLTTLILIIFGLLIIGFQCKKEECNEPILGNLSKPEYDYDFIIDMNVAPLKEVYSIGDTINLSFEISNNTLYDSKSQTDVELGHVKGNKIHFDMSFSIPYVNSIENFSIITDQPDIIQIGSSSLGYDYVRTGIPCELFSDTFQFNLKLVPLKNGIFLMSPTSVPLEGYQFNPTGNCNDNLTDFQTGNISYKFADDNDELLEGLVPCKLNLSVMQPILIEREFFMIEVKQ